MAVGMQTTKIKDEFKQLSAQELKDRLDALRREYFGLRLNAATSHVKDYSQFNKLRKNIARVSTYIRQAA